MRNAQKDLELCNPNNFGSKPKAEDKTSERLYKMPSYIIESREALPYWTWKAVVAEELLKEVLNWMKHEEVPTKPVYDAIKEFLGGGEG
jgi:hypothetical protein